MDIVISGYDGDKAYLKYYGNGKTATFSHGNLAVLERVVHTSISQPTWEELVTQAIEAATIKDAMQWLLGDIANVVIGQPVIGRPAADSDRQTLTTFARDVGKVSASSMQEYAAAARAFPAELRDYDNLSYSHYRAIYRRLKDSPERFEEWLEAASVGGWSIEKLQAELGSSPPAEPKPPIRTESHHMPLADLPSLFSTVDRWHARRVEVSYHQDGKIVMVVMP